MNGINQESLTAIATAANAHPLTGAMRIALSKNNIQDIIFANEALPASQFQFSVNIKTLPVTNQKQSGRCWIFAGLNVLREQIAKNLNLENFELSQNYTAFWDKFEKINYFYESMIALADRPLDDRLVTYLMESGINDGGQWDMLVNVISKYGVVPKAAMPETCQSSATRNMNRILNSMMRKGALALRAAAAEDAAAAASTSNAAGTPAAASTPNAAGTPAAASTPNAAGTPAAATTSNAAGTPAAATTSNAAGTAPATRVSAVKTALLTDAYRLLTMCFGEPPKTFDFEYTDKDDAYHVDRGLTPHTFYDKYVSVDLSEEYVGIINSPTADKPFYRTCTIDFLGNVAEGRPVTYLNLPMEEMKTLIVRQLKDGHPVWFGSDVGFFGDRDLGIWSDELFNLKTALDIDVQMDKGDQLNARESAMNHAMVITGVNLDDNGTPTRWKIENSWSDEHGEKGYYVMTASWFDRFVYQAVIRRAYLTEAQSQSLTTEPLHFMPWDPMGTLA